MARQNINNTPADSGLGDSLKLAFDKVNAMTLELYATDSTFADEIDLINVTIAKVNDGSLLNHTHTIAQIQGLQSTLNSKISASTYIGDMMAINASIQAINDALNDIVVILNSKVEEAPFSGITYGRKDGEWVPLTGITSQDTYVTGGTYSNGSATFKNNSGGTFSVTGFSKGSITSVGLSMPSAFNVSNSPITSAGTINVTAAGSADQYVRGDGELANFPSNVGGGSSISYFLNGSVYVGGPGGVYYEMSRTPVFGTGTTFSRNTNGYIAEFITLPNDPSLLKIPAGNWDFQLYFNTSSNGGNPKFYTELYKYDYNGNFSLISSGVSSPEAINNGTTVDVYTSTLSVPDTVLEITDRLAIRIYVIADGRNITLYTEDNRLAEVHTTFSTGLAALNGLTTQLQYFNVSGSSLTITSTGDTHTFTLLTKIRRHSFTNFDGSNSYDYNGYAPEGSSESANVWTITRLTINAFGSVTKGVATNASWTNRVSATYV